MSYCERFNRLSTEELLGYLELDLASEAKPALLQVLAARGVSAETIEQILAGQLARLEQHRQEQKRLAGPWARLAAFAIDLGASMLLFGILGAYLEPYVPGYMELAIGALAWIYMLFRDAMPGQSLGKRLLRLRVVHMPGERAMTLLSSFLRNLPLLLCTVIDALFMTGERGMRLGDRLARTIVLRAEPAGARTRPASCPPAQQNP